MRILLICGTRPNFVKVAALWHAFAARRGLEPRILHTGQHYDPDLDGVFFQQLGLPEPAVRLAAPRGTDQLPGLIAALGEQLAADRPELVVVVGDVTSTLAASLAASRARVPLAHVEAGLRSFDREMPEELNRLAVDAMSDLLFTSEASGRRHLLAEGVPASHVFDVGNVMIDTLVRERPNLPRDLAAELDLPPALVGGDEGESDDRGDGYAVWTSHRPGNVDARDALAELLETLAGVCRRLPVIFPVHPRSRRRLEQHALWRELAAAPDLHLLPPVGYHGFLALLSRARVVLTDSGGIQEETTYLGVPCLTLRENTERPSTVDAGWNRLVGRQPRRVLDTLDAALRGELVGGEPPAGWDGRAAERVADVLEREGAAGLRDLQATRARGRAPARIAVDGAAYEVAAR